MSWLDRLRDWLRPRPAPVPARPPRVIALPFPPADLLRLHNRARALFGLAPLELHSGPEMAALVHADWMARACVLSHTEPGAVASATLAGRLRTVALYPFAAAGENIAAGHATPEAVFQGWMNSAGHRLNVLGSAFTHVGFGAYRGADGVPYWCAVYAAPARPGARGTGLFASHSGPLRADPVSSGAGNHTGTEAIHDGHPEVREGVSVRGPRVLRLRRGDQDPRQA